MERRGAPPATRSPSRRPSGVASSSRIEHSVCSVSGGFVMLRCATVALCLALFGTSSAWAQTIDQSAPADAPPTLAIGGATQQVVSQTVTAGRDGVLVAVRAPLSCADGTLVVELRNVDASGHPGPTILKSATFPAASLGGDVTSAFRNFRIAGDGAPLRLTAGQRFAISFSNPTGSCGLWPGPVGDPYGGGSGWADGNDGPIVPVSLGTGRDDIPFRTVLRP